MVSVSCRVYVHQQVCEAKGGLGTVREKPLFSFVFRWFRLFGPILSTLFDVRPFNVIV